MSKQKLFKLSLDSITKSKPHFSLYIYRKLRRRRQGVTRHHKSKSRVGISIQFVNIKFTKDKKRGEPSFI